MAAGFEFATGWKVYSDAPIMNGAQHPPLLPKAAVLLTRPGWKMTVDGDEVEFVVDAVPENDSGETILGLRMDELTAFVDRIVTAFRTMRSSWAFTYQTWRPGLSQNARNTLILRSADLKFLSGAFSFNQVQIPFVIYCQLTDIDVAAIPQASLGFRLGRIRNLWRLLGDPTTAAADQMFSQWKTGYALTTQRVTLHHAAMRDSNWPTHKPSAVMRGLLTLILTYLKRGISPNQNKIGAVKYMFVMMSRTKFSTLFNQLPAIEQAYYRLHPDHWVSYICTDLMTLVHGRAVDPEGLIIDYKISDRDNLPSGSEVQIPIKRKNWLVGMTQNRDLFSAEENPVDALHPENIAHFLDSNPGLGHRLRGLAGLGNVTDTIHYGGTDHQGVIIEFRARQAILPYRNWKDYALRMYRFAHNINTGDRHTVVDF
ncbi:hypothetical protein A6C57_19495 [Fibrella sp. ES10-3-2-2]|nr:hypothetical protein A6C57_19495 [Fibrella sp. ES10-3-2-2]